MEFQTPLPNGKITAVQWFKEWVPREVVSTGKRCHLLKWVTEDMLKSLKENYEEPEPEEPKPEPTTEVLFLCSSEGCGKCFTDVGAFRKHSQVHGEGKYAFPVESCGKAFNLDFNLKAHMRTHSLRSYFVCPHPECGRRPTHECKRKTHIKPHHKKSKWMKMMKHRPPADKLQTSSKPPQVVYGSPSAADRPYACPYEGCGKGYIHEYKLNLHLTREHPGHNPEENSRRAPAINHTMDEARDRDAYIGKKDSFGKNLKRRKPIRKMPPAKISHWKGSNLAPTNMNAAVRNQRRSKEIYKEDSQETDEDGEEDGWRYQEVNGGGDEETEDEE